MPDSPASTASPDYSPVVVVIPALNEAQSLPLVLAELPPVGQVIVVDNGSTDATVAVAEAGGAEVVSEPRRGYGSACLAGIRRAAQLSPDVLVILDADHSDYPAELPLLVDPILAGEADFVIGNRTARAERGALMLHQRFGNRLATSLIRRITGHRYQDMGPFRAIRMSALLAMEMEDADFGWNVEMQMKAVYHQLRIQEIPVGYRPRIGQSKISGTIRGSVKAGTIILHATRKYAR